ncbi:hypothetical protein Cpin_1793 [Chitinophaga pinensis DSM 2588]|uniref:Uncharacterized protein n=1 Tax=Chitinophaga pinensis (strain ATCC 43595 / DSM 2588 / LMG 13176 / NBRC 15968 / NCIMB 11800 / UQM 2034) TaxID=485918 RepID=A0A979G1V2_CHIPD|nr:hypothetical protein Cpin_1793 [Chitinophaga pinensis DSM 2588]
MCTNAAGPLYITAKQMQGSLSVQNVTVEFTKFLRIKVTTINNSYKLLTFIISAVGTQHKSGSTPK